jgi:two-component system, chemotaxis family, chemotaxis protein CheY
VSGDAVDTGTPAPERPRLLVVEDDRDVRETLVRILEDAGYQVIGAADGREALTALEDRPTDLPALILLDLRMPRMNGRQLHDELGQHPRLRDIPIIVLSADGRPTSPSQLTRAAAVLAKPVRLEKLLNLVESVLGGDLRVRRS